MKDRGGEDASIQVETERNNELTPEAEAIVEASSAQPTGSCLDEVEVSRQRIDEITAPVRAKALPDRLVLVVRVMLASARIFPANEVPVPSVAELPTCQNTLQF